MSALQLKNPILEFPYFAASLEWLALKIPVIQKKGDLLKAISGFKQKASPALVQEWMIAGEVKDEKFTWLTVYLWGNYDRLSQHINNNE